MKVCLPIGNLSLLQLNSCVALKHGLSTAEGKDGSLKSVHGNTLHDKHEELELGTALETLVKTSTYVSTKEDSKSEGAIAKETLTSYQDHQLSNIATIDSHKDKVFALAVAGDLLYTASDSKDIRVFRAPMFEEVDCFGSGSGVVQSLMAFEDKLYSAHQDNKIRVWKRVQSGDHKCKHKLESVLPRLRHCVKSMLSQRNYVQVRRDKRKLWIEHADMISALALGSGRRVSEAGGGGRCPPSVLYSASWDKTVKVWSLNNFKCLDSFCAHHDAINAMIVIDGSLLATASADCTIKLWTKMSFPKKKKKKHGLINTLEGHKTAVNALAISENFKILYSGGSDGTLIVWKKVYSCKSLQARSSLRGAAISGGLSGDQLQTQNGSNGKGRLSRECSLGRQLSSINSGVSSSLSGEVVEINRGSSGSGGIMSRENSSSNQGLSRIKKVISHYNHLDALISANNSVNFVKKKVLKGHTRAVLSVSTVGDDVVCSSSADKTIRVWGRSSSSAAAGRGSRWEYACMAVLAGHGGAVKAIASVNPAAQARSSVILHHAQEHRHPATASPDREDDLGVADAAACRYGEEDDHDQGEEDDHDQGVIVYSAGLDSKVKVWALNIPR